MRTHTRILATTLTLALGATALACGDHAGLAPPPQAAAAEPAAPRAIDLAICLDTSGSMRNLIDAAKQHIWAVANDLALARPQPRLRVALLTFGNDGYRPEDGWVRVDTDLTEDLDLVSERLFALQTNGGTELVGRVLQRAHDDLSWNSAKDALRLVLVAGNESADQDTTVRYADACAALAGREILVNSIYCGASAHGDAPGWKDVALKADGYFAAIDHTRGPLVVETPFDAELQRLSAALNATYIPVGAVGAAGWANQSAQDSNAAGMNRAAAASRAQTKAGANYRCAWDLVDTLAGDPSFDLTQLKDEDLPEAMRGLDAAGRRKYVENQAKERETISAKIVELSRQRAEHVSRETARLRAGGEATFESALLTAIRQQAGARGFTFVPLAGSAAGTTPPARPAADVE